MEIDNGRLTAFLAKEEIRELALLYSRGIDRRDWPLVRSLYTVEGTDTHGEFFSGTADAFVAFLDEGMQSAAWTGHFIANHLISVSGEEGEGEVYVLAYHLMPDGAGGFVEDLMMVRYLDHYRYENERWRFANRNVTFDMRNIRRVEPPVAGDRPSPDHDPSYAHLLGRLFARGTRA